MILRHIMGNMVTAFVLTVILEAAAAFLLGVRTGKGQLIVFLANVMTNPLLNAILTAVSFLISPDMYTVFLIPLEIAVVFIEGLVYKGIRELKRDPFFFSFLLNACSLLLGTVILEII